MGSVSWSIYGFSGGIPVETRSEAREITNVARQNERMSRETNQCHTRGTNIDRRVSSTVSVISDTLSRYVLDGSLVEL